MSGTDYVTLTCTQLLKKRFKEGKKKLIALRQDDKQAFIDFVIKKEPQYDTYAGGVRIINAWRGITPDLRVTELLTEYVQEIEVSLKNKAS